MKHPTLDEVSNKETWQDIIEFFDDDTGEAYFDYDDDDTWPDEITMKLRDEDTGATVLSGSLTGGELVIVSDGDVQFTFSDLSGLPAKTYTVGLLWEADGITKQMILGRLPVLEGL